MKYIIDIEEKPLCVFDKDTQTYFPRLWRVKGFNSLVFDEEGLSRLEELNSDYINENYGQLQDDAYERGRGIGYQKGFEDGKKTPSELASNAEYQRGLDDAWGAAKKIFGYEMDGGIPIDELRKVFGYAEDAIFCTADIIRHNTASEAIAKLKAYEEQKADDEIKVGDELEHTVSGYTSKAIFLEKIKDDEDWYKCLFWTGCGVTILTYPKRQFKRTGRHFDIDKILEEMAND